MITSLEEAIRCVDELGLEKAKEVMKLAENDICSESSYEHLRALDLFAEALKLRKLSQ
jgi:hypothetical protein